MIAGPRGDQRWRRSTSATAIVNDVAPKDRDIAMVFQNYALYPHMTVYDNLAFGLKLRKPPQGRDRPRGCRRAAEILGLENLLKRKPNAALGWAAPARRARAGHRPRARSVFLMDEPLSNLDAKLRVQTRAELIEAAPAPPDHDDLRHARPGRGDDDGRPDRRHEHGILQQLGTPEVLYDARRTCSWPASSAPPR